MRWAIRAIGAFAATPIFAAVLLEANFTLPPNQEDARWTHSQQWDQVVSLGGGIASYNTIDTGVNASIITAVGSFNSATGLRARMRVIDDDGFNGGGTSMILIRNGYMHVAGIVSAKPSRPAALNALSFGGITQSYLMDTSAFHEYRLQITDVATGMYDIFVDDVLVLQNNQGAFIGSGFDGQAQFADNEGTADAQAEFDWARVEDDVVPTPPDVLTADAHTRGLWYFNHPPGSASVWDASANANQGNLLTGLPFQLDPAVSWVGSRPGYNQCVMGYYTNGANFNLGPIEVPQDGSNMSLAFSPGTDMTIEFWMHPTLIDGSAQYILTKHTGADYHVTFTSGQLYYAWYNGGWNSVTDTAVIPANEWTHVAITVDRSGSPAEDIITFYINDAFSSAHTTPLKGGNPNAESLWIMGASGGAGLANCFRGKLDELRISDVIREYAGSGTITAAEASPGSMNVSYRSRRNGLYAVRRAESPDGAWETAHRALGDPAESTIALAGATETGDHAFFAMGSAETLFADVTDAVGLTGIGHYFGGSWGDFNLDGWPDFFSRNLYRNLDGTSFTQVPISALSIGVGWGGPWGDYDNDGDPDLLALGFSGGGQWFVKLLRNEGGVSFVDDSAKLPSLPMTQVEAATWVDVDNDGDLALYLGGGEPAAGYQPDAVLRNNNDGASFTVIFTTPAPHWPARGATACDFDEDGDLDIYVSNYRLAPNLLWINNGSGSFSEQAAAYGVAGDGGSGAWGHTIGSNWADWNNDGRIDLFVGNFSHAPDYQDRPQFLANMGPSGSFHFQDDSATAGLAWRESYANPGFGDFDNDTHLDFFYTCIYAGDENVLCRNNGDGTFSEVPSEAFVFGNYQTSWADYDGDGDLDLLTSSRLLRNECNLGHWLKVKLVGDGTSVNKSAIGAQVRITTDGKTLTRQVEGSTGGHAGNQNDLTLHFGLATRGEPVDLEVRWPGGATETVNNVAVDQTVTVQR